MTETQQQARRIVNAAREVVQSSWSSAQRAGQVARDGSAESVERALDSIFDEPYDVATAEAARQLVVDAAGRRTSVWWSVIEGFALARLVRMVSRFSRYNVSAAVIAAAPTAVSGIRHAVTSGLVQLRVLASFLASRARAEGMHLDKALIRAATVELYLEPRHDAELRYTGGRAGRAVATRWARDAASAGNERLEHELADERIQAIARLDLRDLERRWRATASPAELEPGT